MQLPILKMIKYGILISKFRVRIFVFKDCELPYVCGRVSPKGLECIKGMKPLSNLLISPSQRYLQHILNLSGHYPVTRQDLK